MPPAASDRGRQVVVGRRAGTRRVRGVRSSGDDPGLVGLGPDAMTGSAVGAAFFCLGPVYGAAWERAQYASRGSVASGRLAVPCDAGPSRVAEPHQIFCCQLDLEPAPAGGDEDRLVLAGALVHDQREGAPGAQRADAAYDVA